MSAPKCKRKGYNISLKAREVVAAAKPDRKPRLNDVEKCATCGRWHIREGVL